MARLAINNSIKNPRICEKHFSPNDMEFTIKSGKPVKVLRKGALPLNELNGTTMCDAANSFQHDHSSMISNKDISMIENDVSSGSCHHQSSSSDESSFVVADYNVSLEETTETVSLENAIVNTTINDTVSKEIDFLKEELRREKEKNAKFEAIFSKNQCERLMSDKRKPWDIEDIQKGLKLHAQGPKLYRHLVKIGFPFPAESTLRHYLSKIQLTEGFIDLSLKVVSLKDLSPMEKVCTLVIDEMKIKPQFEFQSGTDTFHEPGEYVLAMMARGLFSNWKQPIYFQFDTTPTKKIIDDAIGRMTNIGLIPVALTSDLGPRNADLFNSIFPEHKPYDFEGNKIFGICDAPHLLKLIRNHFVDKGFLCNGKVLNTSPLWELISLTKNSDLKVTFKLNESQLMVSNLERQKVKPAAQLFSRTNSKALSWYGTKNLLKSANWKEVADFLELVNDWFDVLNSGSCSKGPMPLGLALEKQVAILNEMSNFVSNARVGDVENARSHLLPFQKGILRTNASVRNLLGHLEDKYGTKYLLTRRLNQDVLEWWFGVIRSLNGPNDHPTKVDFIYRVRKYLCLKSDKIPLEGANTEFDESNTEFLTSLMDIDDDNTNLERDEIFADGLEHLAGHIIFKTKENSLEDNEGQSNTWTDHLSRGGLKKPKKSYLKKLEELDEIARNKLKPGGNRTGVLKEMLDSASEIELPFSVKRKYFRSRIFFKIRSSNAAHRTRSISKFKKNKIRKLQ